jgi:hypothetical protein
MIPAELLRLLAAAKSRRDPQSGGCATRKSPGDPPRAGAEQHAAQQRTGEGAH